MPTTVSCAKSAAALAAAGIVLLNAWEIAARTIDGRFERTLAVGGDTLVLDVQTVSGRIEVTAGEPGQARVTGRIRGYADRWTPDGAGVVEDRVRTIEADPPIVLADDVLRVGHLEPPLSRQVGMSYEIVVPANTRVRARTGSGALLVERVAGPVDVGSGSGGTRVSGVAGNVTVESTLGQHRGHRGRWRRSPPDRVRGDPRQERRRGVACPYGEWPGPSRGSSGWCVGPQRRVGRYPD